MAKKKSAPKKAAKKSAKKSAAKKPDKKKEDIERSDRPGGWDAGMDSGWNAPSGHDIPY